MFSLGSFNFSFILLRASELGVYQSFIPIVYVVINIAHTIIGIPAGILADKTRKEKVLLTSYTIFAISSILMVVSFNNMAYACVLAAIFGLYVGIETVQRAIIPRDVSTELRGTDYGLYSIVIGVCFFVSNITFGFIWDYYNFNMAVVYSVSLYFCAIIGIIIFVKRYSTLDTNGL